VKLEDPRELVDDMIADGKVFGLFICDSLYLSWAYEK
jgi:hypothetical protein